MFTRDVVLEVGSEGGSLTLLRARTTSKNWRFWIERNETALYDLLSEEDRGEIGEYFAKTGYVDSLQEALSLLDRYPWFDLYPLEIHPEYRNLVLAEVRKRGGGAAELIWKKRLSIVANKEPLVLHLKQLVKELIERECHLGGPETDVDNAVINAINQRDLDSEDRKRSVVYWLNRYKVFMGFSTESRIAIAGQIIAFADERQDDSLGLDKVRIVSEFNRLKKRITTVTSREVISLTSKALWCCYPDDVPIFDRNAVNALRVISRICHLTPSPSCEEYACFVDVWFQVYDEIEPVINREALFDCPHKVRVLDRLLWYLGQNTFYSHIADRPAY
jgi:hypothetical protein